MNAIQKAAALVGGQSELARRVGKYNKKGWITSQAINAWCRTGNVPAEYVLGIEYETKGEVTRHELRPDIFPIDSAPKKKQLNNKSAAFQHA